MHYGTSVLGQIPVFVSPVIRPGPVGAPIIEEESGGDEKILCIAVDDLHSFYVNVGSYRNMLPRILDPFSHFFGHYKDLESGKCVKAQRTGDAEEAVDLVRQAITRSAGGSCEKEAPP